MAGPQNPDAPTEGAPTCSACRGTGQVVSTLGGTRSLIPCPWCEGRGVRLRDHDAQRHGSADGPSGDDAA